MIKLTCSSCGGKLEITDDIERFACGHCGTEWLVNRGGGIVSLKSVEDKLEKISSSSEKTAEYSKIVADEIKVKKIKEKITELEKALEIQKNKDNEKIAALEREKNSIDLNPEKSLPSIKNKINEKTLPLTCIGCVSFLILLFTPCLYDVWSDISCRGIYIFFVIGWLIIFSIFIFYHQSAIKIEYLKKKIENKINLQKVAEIEERIKNFAANGRIKELEEEIKELISKAKEIEEGFFK